MSRTLMLDQRVDETEWSTTPPHFLLKWSKLWRLINHTWSDWSILQCRCRRRKGQVGRRNQGGKERRRRNGMMNGRWEWRLGWRGGLRKCMLTRELSQRLRQRAFLEFRFVHSSQCGSGRQRRGIFLLFREKVGRSERERGTEGVRNCIKEASKTRSDKSG